MQVIDVLRDRRGRALEIPGDGVRAGRGHARTEAGERAKELRSLHVVLSPNLDAQSFLELARERLARRRVDVPSELELRARRAQHDVMPGHGDAHAARIELVARERLRLRDLEAQPLAFEIDALVVRRVPRLNEESGGERHDLEAGEGQ